jgi:hypothetical protein
MLIRDPERNLCGNELQNVYSPHFLLVCYVCINTDITAACIKEDGITIFHLHLQNIH